MSNLFENIEYFKAKAVDCFNISKEHPSIFILETDQGIALMPAMFSNNDEKDKIMNFLKESIVAKKIYGFVFIGEAYTKKVSDFSEINEEYRKHGSLKFASGREEILMFQYQSFKHNLFFKANINREDSDVYLGEWEQINTSKKPNGLINGRFDDLFEKANAVNN